MDQNGSGASTPDMLREQASAWLAKLRGEPSQEECAAFEDWYASDPSHAAAYDALLATWEHAGRLDPPDKRRLADVSAPRRWKLAAAAAVVLAALLGTILFASPRSSLDETPRLLVTRVGEIRSVTLQDGSKITLDTDSRLRIAYGNRRRVELERGRARFEVPHEADRSFVVIAGSNEIIGSGTTFDVDRSTARIAVSLLRGQVEVRQLASANPAQASARLAPGERLVLDPLRTLAALSPLSEGETRWISGMLSFEDAPLGDVLDAVNRYNETQVILSDQVARSRRFTGTFKARDPDQLAAMIAATFQLRVERGPNRILLKTPE
ncbi:FecR domain-containing protein [Sphingomonas sp.]|uniref:FecR family protein n=1 Tax=Sphingomonas sp. TaxID=28214 RepID=UPI0031E3F716